MTGLGRGFIISLLVHGLVVVLVYAVPSDRETRPDTISVDFTLVEHANMRETALGLGTGPRAPTTSGARRSVKKSELTPRAKDGANTAESRPMAHVDEDVSPLASLASAKGEGQPSSEEGAPVAGSAGTGNAGGAGSLSSGRPMTASLGLGGTGVEGAGSGDGGYHAVLRRIRDEVLKNVTYPERARRMGWEGKVIISFMIHEDGSVHDARILQSSGVSMLDESAREALRKSTIRSQIAKRVHVVLPIEYKLR